MQTRTRITAATLALMLSLGQAHAQSLRDGATPAEFPPASFTGKQYVDSKGCVFVRAGFDGAVNWVPRVNRKRKVLCGMSPTFASRPAPAEPPRVAAAPVVKPPRVAAVTPPPRTATPTRTVAAPPPRTRAVAPAVRTVTPPVRTVTAPTRVRPAPTYAPRVVTAPVSAAPRTVAPPRHATGCPNMSELSQRYVQSTARHPVRCGPQGVSPTGIGYDGAVDADGVPLQVIRVAPAPKIAPPPGYKAVWEDDRLNPNRGVQTAEGYYQSSLIWTNTVPRRLLDSRTGKDMTSRFPWLKFPYTSRRSMEEQIAYRQRIGENPRGRVVPVTRSTANPTRLSTKAVPPARAVAPPAQPTRVAVTPGHRFVQVGTFGNPANAQNSAARLQRMGLPVRIGTYQKAGKTYKIVLAGPFNSPERLAGGLVAARRAGFSDAYTRK